ncbi:siphovirus Gp157 family protein [Sphingobacterium sp. 1.A.4]|uniref:siphovirus Gp157 family protein n=1 Tax=Sphingobacterium sp. 1.A.4 TaxID=2044603 RepID=UPI000C0BD6E8|nr:siphovirus Gp157 family protein [Sphingobacterium sp. 1.A.4]
MTQSLFHISQEYLQLANILESNGGELTPEIEEQLNANTEALQVKASNIAFMLKKWSVEEDNIYNEIERLKNMLKVKTNSKERLKSYLKTNMEQMDISEIKCDLITVRLQKSKSSVEIVEKAIIPKKFLNKKIDVVPDKVAIKEALESGEKVKGVVLKESKTLIIK